MENIAPLRSLTRRTRQLLQVGFIVLAIGVFLAVAGQVVLTIQLLPHSHPMYQLYILVGNIVFYVGVIVFLIGAGLAIRAVTRRKENDLALMTGDFLAQSGYFNQNYSFIRNINRSGLGYIDSVLVGPPGVLVFRIVNYTGSYANEAGNWMIQKNSTEWQPASTNPTREAVDDIQSMRTYLQKYKLSEVPVFGIVVFTAGENDVQIVEKEPVVPITHLRTLVENLGLNYLVKTDRIPQAAVVTVRRLLLDEN